MSQLLLAIKAEVTEVSQHASALTKERIAHFESRYDGIIQAGLDTNPLHPVPKRRGRLKQSPPKNLLDSLDKHRAEVLAYMYDVNIPFDNNFAERDIRTVKAKMQECNIIGGIKSVLVAQPFIPLATDAPPE